MCYRSSFCSKRLLLLLALITFDAFMVAKAEDDSDGGGGTDDASEEGGGDTGGDDHKESGEENAEAHDEDNNGSNAEEESGQNGEHNAEESEEDNQQNDGAESEEGAGGGKAGGKGGKGGTSGGPAAQQNANAGGKGQPNKAGQAQPPADGYQPPVPPSAPGGAQSPGGFQPGGGQALSPSPTYPSAGSYPSYPSYQQQYEPNYAPNPPYYPPNPPYYPEYRQPYEYTSDGYYDSRQNRHGAADRRDFYDNHRDDYYDNRQDYFDNRRDDNYDNRRDYGGTSFGFGSGFAGRSLPPVLNENNFDPGHAQGRLVGATIVPPEEQSHLPPVFYGSARRFRRSAAGDAVGSGFLNSYLYPVPQSPGRKRVQNRRNGGRRTKRRTMLCFVPSPATRQSGNMEFWRHNLLKYSPNQFQRHFPYRTNGEMNSQDQWRRSKRQTDFPGGASFPDNRHGNYGDGGAGYDAGESNPSLICQPMENNGYGGGDGGRTAPLNGQPPYSNDYDSGARDGRGRGAQNGGNQPTYNNNYDYGNGVAGGGRGAPINGGDAYGNSDGRRGPNSERIGRGQQPRRQ
ncbi:hypothetical protein niasHS_002790 [Heterodera schachtii]|uniref:Uncharacterized protein n=1 Tax=Heterodera schachtii TaxID=97005 RepID=A0ABD2K337_HETSC